VGYNFLLSAIAVQWSILTQGFFHNAVLGSWHKISLSISELILGDFAAGALMISFGAVLGKVSATQLLVMTFFEMVVYAINEAVVVNKLLAVDMGGSMIIHTFGCVHSCARGQRRPWVPCCSAWSCECSATHTPKEDLDVRC